MAVLTQNEAREVLRQDIKRLEGFKPASNNEQLRFGVDEIDRRLPYGLFPTGCVHEVIGSGFQRKASAKAFTISMLARLVQDVGYIVWVVNGENNNYAPRFKKYGLSANQVIFVRTYNPKEAVWAIEEALRCTDIHAVVGEIEKLDFKMTRRFQLFAEKSGVTAFLLRSKTKEQPKTAIATRWLVEPIPSYFEFKHVGIGHPAWRIELLKAKGGGFGVWNVYWKQGSINLIDKQQKDIQPQPFLLQA